MRDYHLAFKPGEDTEHAGAGASIVLDTNAANSQFNHLGFVTRSGTRGASCGSCGGVGFSFATAAGASGAGFVARLPNGHHDLPAATLCSRVA